MSKRLPAEPQSAAPGRALARLMSWARSGNESERDVYLRLNPRARRVIFEDACAWVREGQKLPPALSFLEESISIHFAQEDPPEQPVSLDPKNSEATREGTQQTSARSHYAGFSPASKPAGPTPLPPQIRHQGRYRDLLAYLKHPAIPAELPTSDMLSSLGQDDWRLASTWVDSDCGEAYHDKSLAQMLTARLAEKAAAEFYRKLGRDVADISILQLSGGEGWKTHDLLLDGNIPIDVKNSRSAKNNESTYSEHIVPRRKQTRDVDEGASSPVNVRITAVLSPYLPLKDLKKTYSPADSNLIVLGETSWSEIKELSKIFRGRFFKVQIAGKKNSSPRSNTHAYLFPAWLFNYPSYLYTESRSRLAKLRELADSEWPSLQELDSAKKLPPFHVCLAAGLPVPTAWAERLQPAQHSMYQFLLRHHERRSLPLVFLAVLRQFVRQLRNPAADYHPHRIKPILFETPSSPKKSRNPHFPIGIYDPLKTVDSLIDNLADVWQVRERYALGRFQHFKFVGAGILRAKTSQDDPWTTIMAYCGGSLPERNNAKCGYPDLVLGADGVGVCSDCHRLICPKCGFCSVNCNRLTHTS